MIRKHLLWQTGLALLSLAWATSVASAAGNITTSLTGFTGNSTVPATQTALAGVGLSFSSTGGFEDPPGIDPTVTFDGSGAHFGAQLGDNGGRNYVHTVATDYSKVSFVAEITFVAPDIDTQDIYFGLGPGNINTDFFNTPDVFTPNSSAMYWGETEIGTPTVTTALTKNGGTSFVDTDAPALTDGTHRVRFAYDWFRKTADISFDFNYAGGPFVADTTATAVNTLSLYGPDGWPTEPARVFFGGDDGVVVKDFQVTVSTPSMILGDFNSNGVINAADWAILRSHQHVDLTGMTNAQAYFLGDLTGDKKDNFDDFVLFKKIYDDANGAGGFAAMAAGVPEPSTLGLIATAGLVILSFRRRINRN